MASTRRKLSEVTMNLSESIGAGKSETPQMGPTALSKDVGRRSDQRFGQIAIDRVMADPEQPRKTFDDEAISQLADSIKQHSQLMPIRVRWSQSRDRWIIISGERRWRACILAGEQTIQCHFVESDMSQNALAQEQLIENLLREDLRPIEEAESFQALMSLNDWNGKQLAQALKITPTKVSRSLALLKLPEPIQQQIESGELSPRSAYELTKLDSKSEQGALAKRLTSGATTTTQAAHQSKRRVRKQSKSPTSLTFFSEARCRVVVSVGPHRNYHEIEEALTQVLEEVRLRINNRVAIL